MHLAVKTINNTFISVVKTQRLIRKFTYKYISFYSNNKNITWEELQK